MDTNRRNFILSLFGVVASLFAVGNRLTQQHKDTEQDAAQAQISETVSSLEIPNLAPVEAMSQVYLRLMCESLSVAAGVPVPSAKRYLEAAQGYVLSGGDAFDPEFWSKTLDWLESQVGTQGSDYLNYCKLAAYCNDFMEIES